MPCRMRCVRSVHAAPAPPNSTARPVYLAAIGERLTASLPPTAHALRCAGFKPALGRMYMPVAEAILTFTFIPFFLISPQSMIAFSIIIFPEPLRVLPLKVF